MALTSAVWALAALLGAASALAAEPAVAAAPQPHIMMILVDDYGWNNVGYHAKNQANAAEIITPVLDGLAATGMILDRHYAFRYCSPSRSSFNSGRNPIHVNTGNDGLTLVNPADPVSGFAGIPRNMTCIGNKMTEAGYYTGQAGKWHLGLATPTHTPKGRGYQHSLTYLDGANDYWTSQTGDFCDPALFVDLYASDAPAFGKNNSLACSQTAQDGCAYEDDIFVNFTLSTIRSAAASQQPFFYYFAPHNTHEPLEAPTAQLEKFAFVYNECAAAAGLPILAEGKNNTCAAAVVNGGVGYEKLDKQCCFRQYYSAMANLVDAHIGQVVAELKAQKMWARTLLVVSSDNGGPIYRNGAAGANNYPLRGGKKSNFEGGVRVNTLINGGFLPDAQRGKTTEALMGIEDWYTTFCILAGVDPEDKVGEAAGLPPIDGIDLWPFLSGANATEPRTEVWLGSNGAGDSDTSKDPIVQALIRADGYKILWGNVIENAWTGAFYPNASTNWCDTCPLDCGTIDEPTCLFNVFSDPTEHENVAAANPSIVVDMSKRLKELTKTIFAPVRGQPDTTAACRAGADGWVRPFLP